MYIKKHTVLNKNDIYFSNFKFITNILFFTFSNMLYLKKFRSDSIKTLSIDVRVAE